MIKKELSGAGTTSSPVRAKLRGILDALRDMARPGFLSRLLRSLAWCLLVPSLQGGATTHRPWSSGPGFFNSGCALGPLGQNYLSGQQPRQCMK